MNGYELAAFIALVFFMLVMDHRLCDLIKLIKSFKQSPNRDKSK